MQHSALNVCDVDLFNQAVVGLQMYLQAAAPAAEEVSQMLGMPTAALSVPWVRFTNAAGSVWFSLGHLNSCYFLPFQKHDTLKQLYNNNEK